MSEASALKEKDIWDGDLLGHKEIGETFTNLVKSIDPEKEQSSKVISIEAGFGWGKTFFRTEWAKHLEAEGEVVIQIDAQKSDHSGDPVVTFLGALIAALPETQRGFWTKALGTGKKALWGTAKIAATMAARKAGEEATDALEGWFAADEEGPLEEALKDFSKHASKGLGQQVVAQIAAEHSREKEIPQQLEALRNALTEGKQAGRVIILIDELDRCHPDYVISLLEAMKLVFGERGFVFVLMVNDQHLQSLAEHRFGKAETGERYLDKFVDLRLKLEPTGKAQGKAAATLLRQQLPRYVPYSDHPEFLLDRAADLIAQIVEANGPQVTTMRQIKRIVDRLELVLRCYDGTPIDLPLLVAMSFATLEKTTHVQRYLPRRRIIPELLPIWTMDSKIVSPKYGQDLSSDAKIRIFLREKCPELLSVAAETSGGMDPATHFMFNRSKTYIPSHQRMLDYVHSLQADG